MSLLPFLSLGLALGVAHATDADHVAAVSTLLGTSRDPVEAPSGVRRAIVSAVKVGALWGAGHAATLLAFGGSLIAFRFVLAPEVSGFFELGVAVMLVVLGLAGLRRRLRHAHDHPPIGAAGRRTARTIAIGVVHGLAGSGAVAVAVLAQTKNPVLGVAHLLFFCVGTIAGMVGLTSLMALPVAASMKNERVLGWLKRGAACVSLGLGVLLFLRVGLEMGWFVSASWAKP